MRCGFPLKSGLSCAVRVVPPMLRCRHHAKADREQVRAAQRARTLMDLQREETASAKSKFAALAFEHGLEDQRTIDALTAWRAAKAAEGGPNYPAWFLEEARR